MLTKWTRNEERRADADEQAIIDDIKAAEAKRAKQDQPK